MLFKLSKWYIMNNEFRKWQRGIMEAFMKNWADVMKQITLLGQMGLSLTAPLLLCLFLCSWLCNNFSLGVWVYIPGFFFGLGGSGMTAYKMYRSITAHEKKKKKSPPVSYNKHI